MAIQQWKGRRRLWRKQRKIIRWKAESKLITLPFIDLYIFIRNQYFRICRLNFRWWRWNSEFWQNSDILCQNFKILVEVVTCWPHALIVCRFHMPILYADSVCARVYAPVVCDFRILAYKNGDRFALKEAIISQVFCHMTCLHDWVPRIQPRGCAYA